MTSLYVFGCSNTYGHGLPDCILENGQPGENPSKLAFPYLVSTDLDLHLINYSECGISNKWIYHLILEANIKKNSIVLINWTNINRGCIQYDDKGPFHIGQWLIRDKQKYLLPSKSNKIVNSYYKHIWNRYDSKINLYQFANHVDLLCKSLNSKLFQYCHPNAREFIASWNNVNFPDYDILTYMQENDHFSQAIDNIHPGIEHHKLFAKQIIKDIQLKDKI